MIKYNKYKPTDIGSIPENWAVIRLKDLGRLQNGISNGKDYFGSGFPFVSYGNIYNDTIRLSEISGLANSTEIDQKAYSVLAGDVFFTRTSETIDEIGIASTCLITIPKATFSGFTIRLRPKRRIIQKDFSKYFFKAHINRQFLSKEINLVTRASLSQNVLNNLLVLVPSHFEQIAIAQYLDAKTKVIDKKINLLTKKVDYYKELRKSIINYAVCKGLDKDVKLKESGIEWIGQIPEHWEVRRLKDVFEFSKGKNSSKYNQDYVNDIKNSGIYPVYSGQTENNGVMASINSYDYDLKNEIILVSTVGAKAMETILLSGKFSLSQNCAIISLKNKQSINYLHFFITQLFREERKIIPTIMQPSLRIDDLNKYILLLPPKSEQTAIANYLDEKTQKIDAIVSNIGKQIETIKELRKTLINDVVTGKIKVASY